MTTGVSVMEKRGNLIGEEAKMYVFIKCGEYLLLFSSEEDHSLYETVGPCLVNKDSLMSARLSGHYSVSECQVDLGGEKIAVRLYDIDPGYRFEALTVVKNKCCKEWFDVCGRASLITNVAIEAKTFSVIKEMCKHIM